MGPEPLTVCHGESTALGVGGSYLLSVTFLPLNSLGKLLLHFLQL